MTNKQEHGFSPKQQSILGFPYSKKGYEAVIADGAIRSGKTIPMAIGFVLWAMANFKDSDFIIGSKTVGTAQRNIIKPLQRMTYFQQEFKIHYAVTKGYMTIQRGSTINYFYIFGGSTERSQDVVQGGTMSGAFLDEVALMPKSFVEQVIARCSDERALLWFNCNPEHPTHWFKKEWIDDRENKKALYLHFTMDDNPSLSERVKDRYRRRYSGVFYQRFILGLWTKAEGIIYKTFADNPSKYRVSKETLKTWKLNYISVGIDFGGSKSKTKFVATGFYNNFKDVVALKSRELPSNHTAEELGKAYQEFEQELKDEYNMFFNAYADSAEQILIRSLKTHARFSAIKDARKYKVYDRIVFTDTLHTMNAFWILEGECNDLEKAMTEAVWNEKIENERLDNGTYDVDVLDAFEYSFEREMNRILHYLTFFT